MTCGVGGGSGWTFITDPASEVRSVKASAGRLFRRSFDSEFMDGRVVLFSRGIYGVELLGPRSDMCRMVDVLLIGEAP